MEIGAGCTRSYCMENSLRKRLWICRKTTKWLTSAKFGQGELVLLAQVLGLLSMLMLTRYVVSVGLDISDAFPLLLCLLCVFFLWVCRVFCSKRRKVVFSVLISQRARYHVLHFLYLEKRDIGLSIKICHLVGRARFSGASVSEFESLTQMAIETRNSFTLNIAAKTSCSRTGDM